MDNEDFEFLLRVVACASAGIAGSVGFGYAAGCALFFSLLALVDWKF